MWRRRVRLSAPHRAPSPQAAAFAAIRLLQRHAELAAGGAGSREALEALEEPDACLEQAVCDWAFLCCQEGHDKQARVAGDAALPACAPQTLETSAHVRGRGWPRGERGEGARRRVT